MTASRPGYFERSPHFTMDSPAGNAEIHERCLTGPVL